MSSGAAALPERASSGPGSEYNRGAITVYLVLACFVGACTALNFGYEEFQRHFFPQVLAHAGDKGDAYCKYEDPLLQLFVSVLFLAGIGGAFVGSFISKRWGRRPAMVLAGFCYLAGAALLASAVHVTMLIVGRVVTGLGVGIGVQCGPLLLSEVVPLHWRSAINTLCQAFKSIAILVAQCINYANQGRTWGWRLNLGLAAVPALLLMGGAALTPETPNSLVERGHEERGRRALQKIRGVEDVGTEFQDIENAAKAARGLRPNPWCAIFSRRFVPQLGLLVALQVFTVILLYTPQLFDAMGIQLEHALLAPVIIGAVNIVATFIAAFTVDLVGPTFWIIEASTHMAGCEVLLGAVLARNPVTPQSRPVMIGLLVVVCSLTLAKAWGSPMPPLVCSQVQPLHTRAAGTMVATTVTLALAFIMGQFFLSMLCRMRFGVFFFFAGCLAFMGVFVALLEPKAQDVRRCFRAALKLEPHDESEPHDDSEAAARDASTVTVIIEIQDNTGVAGNGETDAASERGPGPE